ncbi:MAG: MFS transporter [Armatimonadetes bacterium]|nr:MFS transporter [Armatimonadota bacterium]
MNENRYRWVIETLLFLIYFAFGISWMACSPLLGRLEEHFDMSHSQGGLLISVVSMAKAVVPLFAGLLAARIGIKGAVLLGAALSSVSVLGPWLADYSSVLGLRFLFGVGGAIVVTLMGAAVMDWFPKRELPLVNGLNNVAVNAGITAALFLTVPLAERLGWQQTMTLFGLISVLLAVAWAMLGRTRSEKRSQTGRPQAKPSFSEVLSRRETWWIAVAFTGPLALYLALNTWLPTHYQEAFGLSASDASRLTGLFNLVGIPTAIAGGFLTARLGLRRPQIIVSGLAMPLAATGMFLSPVPGLRVLSAVFLGISFFLYVAPLFTIPMELEGMSPQHVAMMTGVIFSLAYLVSFASPAVVGWCRDATGSFVPGLALFAGLSSVLALAGAVLPETGPAARPVVLGAESAA